MPPLNVIGNRWLHGFEPETVAADLEKIGPVGIVRCLLGERRFRPSGPYVQDWNVAAHSLNAALIFLRLWPLRGWDPLWLEEVLCHDLAEAFVGDIPSPVKRHLQPAFKVLEDGVDEGLRTYLNLDADLVDADTSRLEQAVRHCDLVALLLEAEEFGLTLETGPEDLPPEVIEDFHACGGIAWPYRKGDTVLSSSSHLWARG